MSGAEPWTKEGSAKEGVIGVQENNPYQASKLQTACDQCLF